MSAEPLPATEGTRRLYTPNKESLRLIHHRQILYVMVAGIAHVPKDAIDEYSARAS